MTYLLVGIGPTCLVTWGAIFWGDPQWRRVRSDRRFARKHRIR